MAFVIGHVECRLVVRESHSLKDKRRVIRSIKDRLRNQFNVSVAETDEQDDRQRAVIGIAMAGSDRRYVEGALAKAVDLLRNHPVAELIDYDLVVE